MDKRRRTYVRLIGAIRHALNQALTEEHARRGLTQADMARLLGRNPSFISRKLNGTSNMTLETLADLAYALDRPVRVELPERKAAKPRVVFLSTYRQSRDGQLTTSEGDACQSTADFDNQMKFFHRKMHLKASGC